MSLHRAKLVLAGILSLALGSVTAPQVLALEDSTRNANSTESAEIRDSEIEPSSQDNQTKMKKSDRPVNQNRENKYTQVNSNAREERKALTREKLDAKRSAMCAKKSDRINKIMNTIENRTQEHFNRITKTYNMTTAFYESKKLNIANYDELVTSIEQAKLSAESAAKILSELPEFTCSNDGPKADLQNFKNKRLDKIQAFKTYRQAVKELLISVKNAAQDLEQNTVDKDINQ